MSDDGQGCVGHKCRRGFFVTMKGTLTTKRKGMNNETASTGPFSIHCGTVPDARPLSCCLAVVDCHDTCD